MKVKDVMRSSQLVYCSPRTNLQEAAQLMMIANCGVLPVLNSDERVVGIITDRDICLAMSRDHSWSHSRLPVGEIMSQEVQYVYETDNLTAALHKMRVHYVGRLPVVDEYGKLKGILSIHNLFCKALIEQEDLGHLSSSGENIVKTVKALSDRYALRRHKEEIEELKKMELHFVI
ncbi:MAG TPA: CBS domain-containing protein [Bacteroidia bacterium]|jgi:CBS domain-containing protein|nr:CBS domain-containing protein [Bacteroidia bacterium]